MPLSKFIGYTTIGSLIWAGILTYVGYLLGKNWGNIQNVLHPIAYVVVAIVLVIVIYLIVNIVRERKASE